MWRPDRPGLRVHMVVVMLAGEYDVVRHVMLWFAPR